MKIGIDCRMFSSSFTGIGRYVYELVEHLQKIDQKNQYYLFFNDPEFSKYKTKNKNFHKVKVNAKHYSITEQTKYLFILNKYKLDLMHFTHFNAPIFYRRKSMVTIHDLTLHFFPGKKMTSFIHRIAYGFTIKQSVRKASKIISVSEHTAKDLQKILKVDPKKIQVVLEGVAKEFKRLTDQELVDKTLEKYKINRPFLLYTGVWRNHKNLKGLISAFEIIRNDYYIDIQLVITGKKDNVYATEIFREAEKEMKKNNIVFTDLVSEEELLHLLNGAKVYVFPSFYEGFGLPPLEAMACGTPVIASNTSSIPEACGEAAVYFDPYDDKNMAKQIVSVVNNPILYEKLSEKGLEHVKKYSWNEMTESTNQIYRQILNEK
ncbi:glycosyltransferase [Candidatus Peregrinibacteria bacterium]|nr:glycosyltransferase [Candidatus Peregrinibacteria bacterium]